MKFLCVPCDSPMKMQAVGPPERGSLSVVYSCPECGYEMAMLTNPFETQLVQSLGVRIGPDRAEASAKAGPASSTDSRAGTKCPFAAMIPATDGREQTSTGQAGPCGGPIRRRSQPREHSRVRPSHGANRHREIRRERGSSEVDEKILDDARDFFGM